MFVEEVEIWGSVLSLGVSRLAVMSADPVSSLPAAGGLPQPAAIRSQLPPDVAAIFDSEWEAVLEGAKRTQDLQAIHDLLAHWRHFAAAEAAEPGWYFRLQQRAEHVLATGAPSPGGIGADEVRTLIEARLRESAPQG